MFVTPWVRMCLSLSACADNNAHGHRKGTAFACASFICRMHPRRLAASVTIAALLALVSASSVSFAHERRTLAGGKYDVVVGWDTEPAYVNEHNAAGIRISKAGTNPAEPVTGAEKTLQVQIRQGAQTRTFELRAVFGQPGYYRADIVPTRAGDYVWTFTGTIGTDQVNESFDSADGKFDAVASGSDVQFPVAAPDPEQVRVELQAAQSAARYAQTVAYAGVGAGVLGCLIAIVVWLTRPRPSSVLLSSRDAAVRRVPGGGGIRAG
jgi:hypothetical protein